MRSGFSTGADTHARAPVRARANERENVRPIGRALRLAVATTTQSRVVAGRAASALHFRWAGRLPLLLHHQLGISNWKYHATPTHRETERDTHTEKVKVFIVNEST